MSAILRCRPAWLYARRSNKVWRVRLDDSAVAMSARLLAISVLVPLAVILGSWLRFDPQVWSHLGDTVLPRLLLNTSWLDRRGGYRRALLLGVPLAWLTVMRVPRATHPRLGADVAVCTACLCARVCICRRA